MNYQLLMLMSLTGITLVTAQLDLEKKLTNSTIKGYARGIFNVIQFPNTACAGGSGRNGTCYTSSECSSKGGTNDGTCANGYGVCCIIKLTCGQQTSENNSYLIVGPTTSPPQTCSFTICRSSSDICRIRLDFNTFSINGPVVGTAVAATPAAGGGTATLAGAAIGDCTVDTFSVAAPNNVGTPVICGFNTGQHIYVDASSQCARAAFNFGTFSSASRSVDIKVTQYTCGDEKGGPDDCLQYFTSPSGTVTSFNFKLNNGVVDGQATHLSNQLYDICFRRDLNKCAICFIPSLTATNTITNQNSFGLSSAPSSAAVITTAAVSLIDTLCSTDYLNIPGGVAVTSAMFFDGVTNRPMERFCGRFLNAVNMVAASVSICTARRPFRITFRTDLDEVTTMIAATATSDIDETVLSPAGIIGFSLDYRQADCTGALS